MAIGNFAASATLYRCLSCQRVWQAESATECRRCGSPDIEVCK